MLACTLTHAYTHSHRCTCTRTAHTHTLTYTELLGYWIHSDDRQLPLEPLIATSKSFFGNAGYILHVPTAQGDSWTGDSGDNIALKVLVPVDIWGHENKEVSSHQCNVQLFLIQRPLYRDKEG